MTASHRLREERQKLGYTQEAFGKIGGVGKTTQMKYEIGESNPNLSYLINIHAKGADVYYIITGVKFDVDAHSHLDVDILTQVFDALQVWESERGKPVSAETKAKLTAHFYTYFKSNKHIDQKKVNELLELIA